MAAADHERDSRERDAEQRERRVRRADVGALPEHERGQQRPERDDQRRALRPRVREPGVGEQVEAGEPERAEQEEPAAAPVEPQRVPSLDDGGARRATARPRRRTARSSAERRSRSRAPTCRPRTARPRRAPSSSRRLLRRLLSSIPYVPPSSPPGFSLFDVGRNNDASGPVISTAVEGPRSSRDEDFVRTSPRKLRGVEPRGGRDTKLRGGSVMTWFPGKRSADRRLRTALLGAAALALVAVGTAAAITTRAAVAPVQHGATDDERHERGRQHAHREPRHVERHVADHVRLLWQICDGNGERVPRHRRRDVPDLHAEGRRRGQHCARSRDRDERRRHRRRRSALPRARIATTGAGPVEHGAADDQRQHGDRVDAHRSERHVDRHGADHVRLPVDDLRQHRRARATTSRARRRTRTC